MYGCTERLFVGAGYFELELFKNSAILSVSLEMKIQEAARHRILVVDDEFTVRETIKMLLELEGHEIETAKSGGEALAMIRESKFDLILTDYAMPRMTGEELAIAVKARLPSQPIGMITAYAGMLRASSQPVKGTDFLIDKPFNLEDLRAAVAKALPIKHDSFEGAQPIPIDRRQKFNEA